MAKQTFLVDIDLNNNQLLNATIQNLATPPSTAGLTAGYIYFNTTGKTLYLYTGLTAPDDWLDLGFNYVHPVLSALNPTLSGANVLATLTVNATGHVTAATTRTLTAGDIGAAVINDAATNTTQTWSSDKIQDELTALGSVAAGGLVNQGGYNAPTNTPDLDTSPSGAILNGWVYVVTAAGTFFTEPVQIGDMLIANQDAPTTLAHWTVINKNIPDIVDASTTAKGIVELATDAEAIAGTDTTRAITPANLAAVLDDAVGGYSETFGDGSTTSFVITHGLGTLDVLVQVVEVSTGQTVIMQVARNSTTQVTVTANVAPTTNQYRVVIKK